MSKSTQMNQPQTIDTSAKFSNIKKKLSKKQNNASESNLLSTNTLPTNTLPTNTLPINALNNVKTTNKNNKKVIQPTEIHTQQYEENLQINQTKNKRAKKMIRKPIKPKTNNNADVQFDDNQQGSDTETSQGNKTIPINLTNINVEQAETQLELTANNANNQQTKLELNSEDFEPLYNEIVAHLK